MFNTERSSIHTAEINDTEMMANAPSIFAQTAMPGVSGRYTFLPTARIVEAMRAEGWKPIEARQSRPRMEARRGYQMHQVRFQRRDVVAELHEFTPEVVLLNSHDRSSGYELRAGMFRFICRNGLMIADSLIPAIHVRHTGQELNRIIEASFTIPGQLPRIAERVASFRSVGLSDSTARQFATQALALRYSDPALAPIRAEQLLDVRRSDARALRRVLHLPARRLYNLPPKDRRSTTSTSNWQFPSIEARRRLPFPDAKTEN